MTARTNLYACGRVHVIYNVPDHVETGYVLVLDTDRLSEDTPHIAATRNIVNQVLRQLNHAPQVCDRSKLGLYR